MKDNNLEVTVERNITPESEKNGDITITINAKVDAAYKKRGNEYLFINKNNSYLPYAEGFKDGYNLAMQEVSEFKLNSDKPKNAGKWLEEIKEINIDPKKSNTNK